MAAPKKLEKMGFILAVLASVLCRRALAQSSCASTLLTLSSCLNYVSGNTTTPSSSCCSSLANVVSAKPQCLCLLVNGGGASSYGYSINQTLAMALPAVCHVQTPPRSRCNDVGNGPSPSPLSSPADGSTGPTDAPPSPVSSPADGSSEPTDTPSSTTSDPSSIPSGSRSTTFPSANGSSSSRRRSYVASFIQLAALALVIYNCLDTVTTIVQL